MMTEWTKGYLWGLGSVLVGTIIGILLQVGNK